mmetsp:Transcript_32599/g.37529  ORF Transcript_32599/g.37529 Transcript_32599/m.37529 type:complete len:400 (+) Transcript_32599:131-1330(+)
MTIVSILSLVVHGFGLLCLITSSSAFAPHQKTSSVQHVLQQPISTNQEAIITPRNSNKRQRRVRGYSTANIPSQLNMADDDEAAAPKKKVAAKKVAAKKEDAKKAPKKEKDDAAKVAPAAKAAPPKKDDTAKKAAAKKDDTKKAAPAKAAAKKEAPTKAAAKKEEAPAADASDAGEEGDEDKEEAAEVPVAVEVEEILTEEEKRKKDKILVKEEYFKKAKDSAGKIAFANAVGQTAPLGYWDPIGFTADGDQDKFDTYQLFEITHGRVSMLAVTGYLVTGPAGLRFPGAENVPAGFSKPIATLLETKSGQNILLQMLAFFTVASIINRDAEWLDNKAEHVGDFRNGSLDVGWNTFTPEEKIEQRNKEINNGRAAMMGILGLYVHEQILGVSILPGGWLP